MAVGVTRRPAGRDVELLTPQTTAMDVEDELEDDDGGEDEG
jgi:hypothetical protein